MVLGEIAKQALIPTDNHLWAPPLRKRAAAGMFEDGVVDISDATTRPEAFDQVDVFEPVVEVFVEPANRLEVAAATEEACAGGLRIHLLRSVVVEVEHQLPP
jgi:hypothetical protein